MSNLSKSERLRAGLIKLVGADNLVHREMDTTLRDDKGKLSRDMVAGHTIGLLESRLKDCQSLTLGVNAFGKKANVEVDPRNMLGLSRVDRASAVAAINPELMVKDEVTSISANYTRLACGQLIADHIGATVGNDDIGNATIIAAAVSGKYGRKLEIELLGPDETEDAPAPKPTRVKPTRVKPEATIEPFVNDGATAPAIVS